MLPPLLLDDVLHLLELVEVNDEFFASFEGDVIDVIEVFHVVIPRV